MHCYSCFFPIWPCSGPGAVPGPVQLRQEEAPFGKQFRTRKWHRRGEMGVREAWLGWGKHIGRFQLHPTVWFSLTGLVQVSAGDDSHLSFLRLGCRRHHMCYQQCSHIPIMVGTHSLLPWHQSTTQLSICRWSDKQEWLEETRRQGKFIYGNCCAGLWGGSPSTLTERCVTMTVFGLPLFWRWNAGGENRLGHIH